MQSINRAMTINTNLLEDLFKRSDFGKIGVDRRRFRADHSSDMSAIDILERTNMIRVENNLSFITLLGLAELNTQDAKNFFVTAERIYTLLVSRYKTAPGLPVLIVDLAAELSLDFIETFRCVSLMAECYLCNDGFSGPQTINNPEQAQISPAESILLHPTFKSCLQKIREAHEQSAASASEIWQSFASPNVQSLFTTSALANELPAVPPQRLVDVLPSIQAILLEEVYVAINHKLLTLASMGLRAVIDMVCNDQIGDKGGFAEKLKAMCQRQIISTPQLGVLLTVVDAGNASAHRGFTPDEKDIQTVLKVVEHLLDSVYVHPKDAAELAKKTPARPPR